MPSNATKGPASGLQQAPRQCHFRAQGALSAAGKRPATVASSLALLLLAYSYACRPLHTATPRPIPRTFKLNTGAHMPSFGLGTYKSGADEVGAAVRAALQAGYRHVDCAARYRNEHAVGSALQAFLNGSENTGGQRLSRSDLFVTGKLWNTEHAPQDVRPALLQTLKDLSLDYLDLYLMHWPVALSRTSDGYSTNPDAILDIPLADTYRAMVRLVEEGLVRAVGVSNFSKQRLEHLIRDTGHVPAVNQVEMHPYLSQQSLLDYCHSKGVLVVAYSPLGSPAVAEAVKSHPPLIRHPTVEAVAKATSMSTAQVLLSWNLGRGVGVIPKSVHADRIATNLCKGCTLLAPEDQQSIDTLATNQIRYMGAGRFLRRGETEADFWCGGR